MAAQSPQDDTAQPGTRRKEGVHGGADVIANVRVAHGAAAVYAAVIETADRIARRCWTPVVVLTASSSARGMFGAK